MGELKRVVSIGAHSLDAELMGGPLLLKYAKEAIALAGGSCKLAVTMILADCTVEEAKERLERCGGSVRQAIAL